MGNAYSDRTAVGIANLLDNLGNSAKFARFETTLAGEEQGRGKNRVRRGNHKVVATVLVGNVSYESMLQRSFANLTKIADSDDRFVDKVAKAMNEEGIRDGQTGREITPEDVWDALYGLGPSDGGIPGRKGLLTAWRESLRGENPDSTSKHVYEPLVVDNEEVKGAYVYTGEGNPEDPEAPVPGAIYFNAVTIFTKVVKPSPNGNIIPSRSGAVVLVKKFLPRFLGPGTLPVLKFKRYRLLPGVPFSIKSGNEGFELYVKPNLSDNGSINSDEE